MPDIRSFSMGRHVIEPGAMMDFTGEAPKILRDVALSREGVEKEYGR